MPQRDPDKYRQGDDGLIVEVVGPWASDKLKILTDYIHICRSVRKKLSQAAFIDPFCSSGRSVIRDTNTYIDGSPVAAFRRARSLLRGTGKRIDTKDRSELGSIRITSCFSGSL